MISISADIEAITRTIWSTLFDVTLEPGDEQEITPEPSVTSCVHIDGAWAGALAITCPLSLAQTLTAQMFQNESAPDDDDVRDALGEVANMLGGNVKTLLPSPSRISLPTVAIGSDYELRVVGTREMARVLFTCNAQPLIVTLLERLDADEG